jgi:hypothetical protein
MHFEFSFNAVSGRRELCTASKRATRRGNETEGDPPGYQDVFTDSELPRERRIMKDGTSVRWPAG